MSVDVDQSGAAPEARVRPVSMLRSGIQLSLISLAIAGVSFANQLILAAYFGTSLAMSSYLVAYSVPAVATGVLTMLFSFSAIPVFVAVRQSARDRNLLGGFAAGILILAAIICVLFYVISPLLISIVGSTLPSEWVPQAVEMARVLGANAAASLIVAFLMALQNAHNRYAVPLMASALPYFGMIALTVAWGKSIGSRSTAYGMLAGTIVGIFCLAIPSVKLFKAPQTSADFKPVIEFFANSPLVVLAMLAFGASAVIESFWGARLDPVNVAYLGYSQRLVNVVASLVAFGPSAVLATRLSESHANADNVGFRRDAARALKMVLFVSAAIAVVISCYRTGVIRLLFERKAFGASSTAGVALLVPAVMIGSLALTSSIMLMKALYAKHSIRAAAMVGVTQVALYFALAGLLSSRIGVVGIATAFAISWWTALLAIVFVLWKGHAAELADQVGPFAWRLAIVIVCSIVVGSWLQWFLLGDFDGARAALALRLIVGCGATALTYVGVAAALQLEEVKRVAQLMSARLGLGSGNGIKNAVA